jgi:hypothetical protein
MSYYLVMEANIGPGWSVPIRTDSIWQSLSVLISVRHSPAASTSGG